MDERMKILEMLAEGTITVEEAKELLDTLDNQKVIVESKEGTKAVLMGDVVRSQAGKVLHIKVASEDGDKVDVNIPLAFLKAAIKIGNAKDLLFKSAKVGDTEILKDIDPDIIISSIEHGIVGKIVDVKSANGDIVEIYID
ncbi:MAG TPA: DUF2089 domain-containing protein [Acholeplasmataceae bacterium]|jgi:hypothetical protein|nr:DUF2089 domain-containing protein [Acholeplasmataceae bacterium]